MGAQEVKKSDASSEAMTASDFVHLHNHTHYSLLDGLTKVPTLVDQVKAMGMNSVAITDHGTMSGAIEFYKAAHGADIKPIIGIETYVAARTIHDRDPAKDKARYHLILLAMNNIGYQNLMQLSTIANLQGVYYKPRVDHELLEKYSEGLIVLSGCIGGELGDNLRLDNDEKAYEIAKWYKSVFGDRYYIEVQDHGHEDAPGKWDEQVKVNNKLYTLADELDIPLVVTSDAHYLKHEDQDAHEILLCVQTGAFLTDQDRMSLKEFELHVTDPKELIARWSKTRPDAITNTRRIAERCDVTLEMGKILIPRFPTPDNQDEKTYLHRLVWQGLVWRYGDIDPVAAAKMDEAAARSILAPNIIERAEFELGVIESMGFNGYFLIIWDFINWGKNQGIIFGPGRGSAAGSIIAYGLNITDLDPIKYDLLFERFLNPDRISMPDIDIDIQDTRRDEVIEYCAKKYGDSRVANIVTFGKMAARAAVRDVARVLQVPYAEADRLSKMIPPPVQGRHIPLSKSVVEDADLKAEYESNPIAKQVFDYAIQLEGTIRSHGVHAAGVVIAPDDIVKYAPLEMAQKGVVATQYAMGPIEELGLLKMDFLGLSNLTIINNALRIIKKVYQNDIVLSEIPLDDAATYELFQRGDTTGVFQLESAGMKRYLRELKPSKFDDIIAMVALYRPGPMQFIDSFIRRKHGEEAISYLHPKMENALSSTYGILVYQEQFMQISKDLAGFTGGQADTLRKAVGKKIIEMMQKVKPEFIEGAIKHSNADRHDMEKFWAQLEEFANYCFNKSHAACYGLISYWTAYLKAHYPDAFMAALMTSDADNLDRLAIEINECRHMGIKVLAPDINQSFVEFGVVGGENKIRFGMAAVKGVGVGAVEAILEARDQDGAFRSIEDFIKRVPPRIVNRRVWENLIKTGAFDAFSNRSDLLFNLDTILGFASKIHKEAASGQADLFGGLSDVMSVPSIMLETAPQQHSEREQLQWERELLGLYVSSHPLDKYDAYFSEETLPLAELSPQMDNRSLTVGGVVVAQRQIVTKSGSKMAFTSIEDKTGELEIIVFPKLFETVQQLLQIDAVLKINGKISARDRDGNVTSDIKLIADEIVEISESELDQYQSTGKKKKAPRVNKKAAAALDAKLASKEATNQPVDAVTQQPKQAKQQSSAAKQSLYVHIKNPDQRDKMLELKKTLNAHPGHDEVILVLGNDKNSAVRLPFTIAVTPSLLALVETIYSKECVVVK